MAIPASKPPAPKFAIPAYANCRAFDEVPVAVGSAPYALSGTLSLPRGDGPFPAIVLVHGSGPNDRDETIGAIKVFRDLSWGLASNGIAVLRYEKRSRQYPGQMRSMSGKLTVKEETIDDAVAALDTLKQFKQVDRKHIFILGHSLGGTLIPRIAELAENAYGFIILAGATRPLEDLILEQKRYILSLKAQISEQDKQRFEELQEQVKLVKDPRLSPDTPAARLPFKVPAVYWLYLRDYNPDQECKRIKRPLLILQGERDYQVTLSDFRRWQAALARQPNVTIKLYPGLSHAFTPASATPGPRDYSKPRNVSPEVIADVASWIKQSCAQSKAEIITGQSPAPER